MYEHRSAELLTTREFARRMIAHGGIVAAIIIFALGIGIIGYHDFAKLPWVDALLNASMILGGMGPVDTLHTTGAKLFASFYALFSGVVFIGASGVLLGPFFHRMLHTFHLERSGAKSAVDD